jgi:hypothetical protein
MCFVVQGIRNHIRFDGVIVKLKIIVLDQLQPSSLTHAQIRLGEKVLQALEVGEDMSHIPKKIMPLGTQGMNHNGQLKIMSGIVLFMRAQLMRGVRNHVTFLHENTAKPSARCITVNNERSAMSGCANTRDVVSNFFRFGTLHHARHSRQISPLSSKDQRWVWKSWRSSE